MHYPVVEMFLRKAPDIEELKITQEEFLVIGPAVRQYCVDHGLLADNQIPYWFHTRKEWAYDIRSMGRKFRALESYPPVTDVHLLPPLSLKEVEDAQAWNDKHVLWLESNKSVCMASELHYYDECLRQTRQLKEVYNCLFWLVKPDTSVYEKRGALAKLQELLGAEDYAGGRLPAPVPTWQFRVTK